MANIELLREQLEKITGRRVVLTEENEIQVKSAVAIVIKDGKVLMGISKNTDDRLGKLCFPGGGANIGETVYQAAKRETYEEAGVLVKCQPIPWLVFEDNPTVAFVLCKYLHGDLKPNHEFENLDWYDYNKVSQDKLYKGNFNALMHFKK